ncbi:hypothetical protein [Streptomyces sp. NPDC002676]
MNATPTSQTPRESRTAPWWTVPALFTPLALLLALWGQRTTPLPPGWGLYVVIPLGVVAASWRRTLRQSRRLWLAISGAVLTFLYTKAVLYLVMFPLALVLWLLYGHD